MKKKRVLFSKKIVEEYPYLVDFLDTKDVIGGIFKEDSFIENAEKKYSKRKLAFRKTLREGKGMPKENLQKAQNFASLELTQYVQFRDNILNEFSKLLTPTTLEKEIHNLFIPQHCTADKTLPLPLKNNNLWILDDNLMSYSYLQSEKRIKAFISEVKLLLPASEKDNKELRSRPDIALYFDSDNGNRAVLIEFKSPTADYKNSGVSQLMYYAQTLQKAGVTEMYLYLILDNRIRETYAAHSKANLRQALYDSYIRAIRWASDRIDNAGIIGFVTNGSFINGYSMNGLRKSLAKEFTSIYVLNLRGDIRKNMLSNGATQEGENVFGNGSMTGIAVTLFVKNSNASGECKIYYHDIGNNLSTEKT